MQQKKIGATIFHNYDFDREKWLQIRRCDRTNVISESNDETSFRWNKQGKSAGLQLILSGTEFAVARLLL